ncbi:Predicted dehydrogenase [Geodermatophilus pulveris]|uniref:Predicted dehydrogenase n=1 Tax=Geodermatophilus pulveris TaxID=1564159 RepID=A0A239B1N8_9ACTN|nr:Gfo/Idh/MocA family oxidoreductase [Geodermatophilus pulveris]SNS01865.1 Predicted dehydrogenase [Geodermatophilus pulveris]
MTRVAVVGAGMMGGNHARVLSRLSEAEVTLVVDPDEQRGRALAASVGAAWSADAEVVADRADAAVVAGPSQLHAAIGVPLLEAGVDLLVEKPIATTTEDADRLIEAARRHDRVLMIGHIERFNPAVLQLDGIVEDLLHVELTRMGPFSPRVTADVVLDLMIHDLELALALAGSDVARVEAVGRRERSGSLDLATALLEFADGVTATLTASRVGQTKIRRIELTQRANFVVLDLVRQDLTVHRVDHDEFLSEGGARYRQTGLIEIPFLDDRGEPLALELGEFLECVAQRRTPRVTGTQGRRALELALAVRRSAGAYR